MVEKYFVDQIFRFFRLLLEVNPVMTGQTDKHIGILIHFFDGSLESEKLGSKKEYFEHEAKGKLKVETDSTS